MIGRMNLSDQMSELPKNILILPISVSELIARLLHYITSFFVDDAPERRLFDPLSKSLHVLKQILSHL